MARPRVAILASGGGTTAESFINYTLDGKIDAEVVLVISNKGEAGIVKKIKHLNASNKVDIKILHIGSDNYPVGKDEEPKPGMQTKAEEEAISKALSDNKVDLIFLLGYTRWVGKKIVAKYGWQKSFSSVFEANMFNTHPGLLPATQGLFGTKVQEKVLADKHLQAGHCIFAVDDGHDDGPIITEHKVKILDGDTADSLSERVKESEKMHLADDINYFLNNKYKINKA